MKYIDIHGHMNFAAYDADRAQVLDRAHGADLGMVTVGTDLSTSTSALELAKSTENMWATVGFHPVFAGESHNDPNETGDKDANKRRPPQFFDDSAFRELAKDPKVVAIGECGLDFFHSSLEEKKIQTEIFEKQIALANELNKPLMLHVRNGKNGGSAYLEAVQLLKERAKVKANFHFFAGDMNDIRAILDLGASVSFTGVITFARNYDEVIRYVPLERIMTETDCPYVSPLPYRGKRNEPMFVTEVVKALAQIRGEGVEKVGKHVVENAVSFLEVKPSILFRGSIA